MTVSFGERLAAAFEAHGQLCLGIDPHPYLLEEWDLPNSAEGVRSFGLRVVAATVGRVGIVKPQIAFFERHGSAGYRALEDVLSAARSAGLLIIADVKRGDVGSTVEAYAQAWLTSGSPLEADAMTVSAYQGVGSLAAPCALGVAEGKGLFVLAATSNPQSFELQRAILSDGPHRGKTVAASIVDDVAAINSQSGSERIGSVGVVLGATVDLARAGIDLAATSAAVKTPILAPGFGYQGASLADVGRFFGAAAPNVVVNASRSILGGGISGLTTRISDAAQEAAQWAV